MKQLKEILNEVDNFETIDNIRKEIDQLIKIPNFSSYLVGAIIGELRISKKLDTNKFIEIVQSAKEFFNRTTK